MPKEIEALIVNTKRIIMTIVQFDGRCTYTLLARILTIVNTLILVSSQAKHVQGKLTYLLLLFYDGHVYSYGQRPSASADG